MSDVHAMEEFDTLVAVQRTVVDERWCPLTYLYDLENDVHELLRSPLGPVDSHYIVNTRHYE